MTVNSDFYKLTVENTVKDLKSSPTEGLTDSDAHLRLEEYGKNSLKEPPKESVFKRIFKQFTDFIILVLIGAAVISLLLHEIVDAIAILAIVLLNGILGFTQEEKAERVLQALKKMSAPLAHAVRSGEIKKIRASRLVPGDIIVLEAGDSIPADCRIIESTMLKIDESSITGESHGVDKNTDAITITGETLALGDQVNMAFMGTTVSYGKGRAIVTSTGMTTEMGKIAKMIEEVKREPTPLQKKLEEFGKLLVYAAGAVCLLIFVLGILRGEELLLMFLTAVSLAVAAIPEGLPAVVTIVLALGVQRMVKHNALIRKLPSVETLGSATIIASDKTGTITQNQMTVRMLYLATGEVLNVTGSGYSPGGEIILGMTGLLHGDNSVLDKLFETSFYCNDSTITKKDSASGNIFGVIGDPTEGALLALANKGGLTDKPATEKFSDKFGKKLGELPFDSTRKMMSILYKNEDQFNLYTKGAPEQILSRCTHIMTSSGGGKAAIRQITDEDILDITNMNTTMAEEALRVLALAVRMSHNEIDMHNIDTAEQGLVFVGLAGMIDPPRDEVFLAVEEAKHAGITPIMITGDHKITATAIAKEIGAFDELNGDIALTGVELDGLSDEEFAKKLPHIKVYARVNPEHKLKVVKAWKSRGDIIAMTGDGVNDAPALKESDIGIAMGITGTDVTKEASDMVLTDDNFASIVTAIKEGRGIFDNIKKVVHFLLSCNIGEILVLLIASIAGMPLPLLPIHILWTNLVTDSLPAIGLAMEETDKDIMDKPVRRKDEGIITSELLYIMTIQGVFMALCTLVVYAVELYYLSGSLVRAQTMAFTTLVFCQKFHVFNCRSTKESVFSIGIFSNKMLNAAVAFILLSQVVIIHVPGLEKVFKITALTMNDWIMVVVASIQPLIWMELYKYFYLRANKAGRAG